MAEDNGVSSCHHTGSQQLTTSPMPRLKGTVLETVTFPRWLFLLFPYLFIHNEEQLLKSQRDCTSIFKGSKERGKYED